jgi:hypothetical protein
MWIVFILLIVMDLYAYHSATGWIFTAYIYNELSFNM